MLGLTGEVRIVAAKTGIFGKIQFILQVEKKCQHDDLIGPSIETHNFKIWTNATPEDVAELKRFGVESVLL